MKRWKRKTDCFINLFHAPHLFWYPLKTSENLWFSDVFMGYQKRSVAWNEFNNNNSINNISINNNISNNNNISININIKRHKLLFFLQINICIYYCSGYHIKPLSANPTKWMVKHTQTIPRKTADELFEST